MRSPRMTKSNELESGCAERVKDVRAAREIRMARIKLRKHFELDILTRIVAEPSQFDCVRF